jgi:hypothetical protein
VEEDSTDPALTSYGHYTNTVLLTTLSLSPLW